MSAAAKRAPEPTPTPFASPERAALAHAIAAAADAGARRVALEQAAQTANADVLRAIQAAEAAEAALAEAQGNAARHMVDKAMGNAGEAPLSVREARAAVIRAQDDLDECRQTRSALKAEAEHNNRSELAAQRVADAAYAVIRSEVKPPAAKELAAEVALLQKQIVAKGSGLRWLASAKAVPDDAALRSTVTRMDCVIPWTIPSRPGEVPFAEPIGSQRWKAAFEALKRDANAALPEDDLS